MVTENQKEFERMSGIPFRETGKTIKNMTFANSNLPKKAGFCVADSFVARRKFSFSRRKFSGKNHRLG